MAASAVPDESLTSARQSSPVELKRYEILLQLATGGMAEVLAAIVGEGGVGGQKRVTLR
jgi:hypothetical protein